MSDFVVAHNIVMGHEGGYANDPVDNGGETYKGIARKRHPNWRGWPILDNYKEHYGFPGSLDQDKGLQQLVLIFYKTEFWNALNLDNCNNQAIANEMYDTAVNMGVKIAAQFLQTALNVSNRNGLDYPDLIKDGVIGPKSLSYLNKHERQGDLLKVLNCLQGARYIAICEADPKQERFFRSWFNRVRFY